MDTTLKLPVGIEDFQEIRRLGFYYIDKTKLIEQLLEQWGKVNLFTRPRRFGKTLNMSMLQCFFEIGADKTLFDGLYISDSILKENTGYYRADAGWMKEILISPEKSKNYRKISVERLVEELFGREGHFRKKIWFAEVV